MSVSFFIISKSPIFKKITKLQKTKNPKKLKKNIKITTKNLKKIKIQKNFKKWSQETTTSPSLALG